MNKILIIIQREFLNRVSKKSFILLTILMPFIFAALIFVPALLSTVKSDEVKQVVIIDHTQKYIGQFKDDESYHFIAGQEMLPEYRSDTTRIDAVVEITEDLIQNPTAAAIYSRKEVTKGLLSLVNNTLNEQIRHDKLTSYNIPELQNIMQDFDKRYSARTIKWSEDGSANESNAGIAVAVGMILTFLIYMFVWRYGDAECHGRKDKPHCRVNGIIGQAASTDAWQDYRYRSGRHYPTADMGYSACCTFGYRRQYFRWRCSHSKRYRRHD